MKRLIAFMMIFVVFGCETENAPDCFQKAGKIIQKEVSVEPFTEIEVFERIKLYIQQGPEQKVVIETGKNLMNEVSAEVENGRLLLYNENGCNLFRDYGVTKIYVTTPDLTWLQSSSNIPIESIGTLKFDNLWLRSLNQEMDPEIHTDGDFILDLDVKNLRITSDNYAHFYISGKAENVNIFFAAGDGRLEGRDFIVQNYDIFHRGTNSIIVNPQQSLKGDIYSYGDIISVNRPPVVRVNEHFRGRLIFESP
ncbi:DUF2807 domain-containing protein [Christiangramia fulva]|uniref:DUF2807 domain-containing protein n=1 Tax=Christiangramia fulva TaxID=2126553 RepID=A0A2R3Z5D9_9FLAO|nr:head GIN domain-containing protein [Christiangramia fulva]AVR45496.1 DUF2807 domain-containing protein [Christiangramia fulva]